MYLSLLATLSLSGLALSLPTTEAVKADCTLTRAQLQTLADTYITAQSSGSSTSLSALSAPDFIYTENRKNVTLTTGALGTAMKIDHNRTTIDTTQCATFTELIVTDKAAPHVLGTQIRYTPDGKVKSMLSIVTKTGDWLFNVTGTLYYVSREDWGPIPEAKRDNRAIIQAAGDAYCDLFKNKATVVPWGLPCERLEGGSYTGSYPSKSSDTCNVGVPSGVDLHNRQYVVDEVLGTVDIIMDFATLPDSHEFRVEGGKLRFVHTMSVQTK